MNLLLICFRLHYVVGQLVICLLSPVWFLNCAELALAGCGYAGASCEQLSFTEADCGESFVEFLLVNSKL